MKFKIIDCDRHVIEPSYLWQAYSPDEVFKNTPVYLKQDTQESRRDRVARLGKKADIALPPQLMIGSVPVLNNWHESNQVASAHINQNSQRQRFDATLPHTQIETMDTGGIGRALLFPTFAMLVVNHADISPQTSYAYARAYNHWLQDYINYDRQRLIGVGLVSRHEPANMCQQIEEIASFGWRCITLRPEVIAGRGLGHEDYELFWQMCEQKNITIAFHGGTHLHGPTVGSERFSSRFGLHACSHPMEIQMAFVSLLESGVLERYPKLKFAFLEAGCSWIPHWLWRLDNICYPEFPALIKENIRMLPSEYFKRHCWTTLEIGEPCLKAVVDMIGHENILFGSDFPHPDHLHFELAEIAKECAELTPEQLKDILEVNPQNCFALD
ncbi:amidohydrolase family protein [Thalassomonas haliotis]|uniref:Amidohydrolase n=1 Tax=Thalassomonas haliotis TaxID=485448 RepID=A0ABY7VM62_9GAMM|nr:amidohydrolase family protein [Thalassomonas haliotis]WDE14272.1 amidohydrolase [Thalassomonas haliotis]